jgi:RHS repeat-associated protein
MAGISSKALAFGEPKNKEHTFQDQRLDDDLGLNWVQFKWRNHDPQIGRFIEIDPLSEKYDYNSTYAFSENKLTVHVELEGLEAEYINSFLNEGWNLLISGARWINSNLNPVAKVGEIVLGRSIESDFKESKPRAEAGMELMMYASPVTKGEAIFINTTKNAVVNSERQIAKNYFFGKEGEKIINESLSDEFKGKVILKQVRGKFDDNTWTVIDNVVVDPKTNTAVITNETKTGASKASIQQARRHAGESVTLVGKNAGSLIGQKISTAITPNRISRVDVKTKEIKVE